MTRTSLLVTASAADTAAWCRATADQIQCQLIDLKRYVLGQHLLLASVPPVQVRALMAAYDIYARILDEALSAIASDLAGADPARPDRVAGDRTQPTRVWSHRGPAGPGGLPGSDRIEDVGHRISQVVTEVMTRLAELASLWGGGEPHRIGPGDVHRDELVDDWHLAVDGLFGSTGVLRSLVHVMDSTRVPHDEVPWATAQR